ncbi:MAG: transposase [Planctomycetota bacterium]
MRVDPTSGAALSADRRSAPERLAARAQVVQLGVERLLAEALDVEAQLYTARYKDQRDEAGKRLVVRNGYLPARTIRCGAGAIRVRQPRVCDNRTDERGRRKRYASRILPAYARTATSIRMPDDGYYFQGLATGDLTAAFRDMLGAVTEELPGSFLPRLREIWESRLEERQRQSLRGRRFLQLWADEIPLRGPMQEHSLGTLTLYGSTTEGRVELLAARVGLLASEGAWIDLLTDLHDRGMKLEPECFVDAGSSSFWGALRGVCARINAESSRQMEARG